MTIIGDIRPSQLLFTYGMGSLINLPKFSAVVQGIESWRDEYAPSIHEERLLNAIRSRLGKQIERLALPPINPEPTKRGFGKLQSNIGLTLRSFPDFMVCPQCRRLAAVDGTLFRFKEHKIYAHEHCFIHDNCSKGKDPQLIPSRFFVVCENGHMDDFPWHYYVHQGNTQDCNGELKLYNLGAEISMIRVKCEGCGKDRSMADAFKSQQEVMPRCQGIHIHLGDRPQGECTKQMKPMTLGSSNAWFAHTLAVVSIPAETDSDLEQRIEEYWDKLNDAEDISTLKYLRKQQHIPKLHQYSLEEIFAVIRKRQQESDQNSTELLTQEDLLEPEYQVLANPHKVKSSADFKLEEVEVPDAYQSLIDKVVLVHRLREVRALIGFTRIMAPDHLELQEAPEQLAPISKDAPKIIPASEVRGEGLFITLKPEALAHWLNNKTAEEQRWKHAHIDWRTLRKYAEPEEQYPGLQYILLHSLSHALMRQLSLECGYSTASIREKIYSFPATEEQAARAGILIYTSAPDSEGTLGGLVELGRKHRLGYILGQALEHEMLCSSDPLCAEHDFRSGSQASLHAAACHACLFAPETSCERGNRYLDRAVLIPTLSKSELAFFND